MAARGFKGFLARQLGRLTRGSKAREVLPVERGYARLMMLDDDLTPMAFVIEALQNFFGMSKRDAESVMFRVHSKGLASCGDYPADVAARKAEELKSYARRHGHPLTCTLLQT